MKKITIFALAIIATALASCSNGTSTETVATKDTSAVKTVVDSCPLIDTAKVSVDTTKKVSITTIK